MIRWQKIQAWSLIRSYLETSNDFITKYLIQAWSGRILKIATDALIIINYNYDQFWEIISDCDYTLFMKYHLWELRFLSPCIIPTLAPYSNLTLTMSSFIKLSDRFVVYGTFVTLQSTELMSRNPRGDFSTARTVGLQTLMIATWPLSFNHSSASFSPL